jgi:hypothetical protein
MLEILARHLLLRAVGGVGAGDDALRLGTSDAVTPGSYLIRLTRDGHSVVTRLR